MCATINTSPEPASVVTQVTKPSASNLGVSAKPSSRSKAVPGGANDMLSDIAVLQLLHWPARLRTLVAPSHYLYKVQSATRSDLNLRSCDAQRGLQPPHHRTRGHDSADWAPSRPGRDRDGPFPPVRLDR